MSILQWAIVGFIVMHLMVFAMSSRFRRDVTVGPIALSNLAWGFFGGLIAGFLGYLWNL